MILSVSRRTDIPNFYSDWFVNRVKEGFLYVRNPMNTRQVSRIDISPALLCGKVDSDDRITERKVKSFKDNQMSFL